jgi:hypothetical protein
VFNNEHQPKFSLCLAEEPALCPEASVMTLCHTPSGKEEISRLCEDQEKPKASAHCSALEPGWDHLVGNGIRKKRQETKLRN